MYVQWQAGRRFLQEMLTQPLQAIVITIIIIWCVFKILCSVSMYKRVTQYYGINAGYQKGLQMELWLLYIAIFINSNHHFE